MKKTILLLVVLTMVLSIKAQEKTKQTEVGLAFSNLYNFGINFKKGSDKFMMRFTTVALSGRTEEINDTISYTSSGLGVAIGNEFIKKITENMEFHFGYDLGGGFNNSKSTDYYRYEKKEKYVQINLVIGLKYVLKEHFVFGAELLPYYKYSKVEGSNRDNPVENGFSSSYGLSNSSAQLLIAYRF